MRRTFTGLAAAAALFAASLQIAAGQAGEPGKPAGTPGVAPQPVLDPGPRPGFTAKGATREEAVREGNSGEKHTNIAFLVGIGEYDRDLTGMPPLKYPAHDVVELAGILKREGYKVTFMQDSEATASHIRTTFRELAKLLDNGGGTFIFVFSGHGFQSGNENYLATYGTTTDNLAAQGLPLTELISLLAGTGAKRRIAFVDACRNDPDAKSAGRLRTFADLQESEGLRILYSTAPGGVSYEDETLQHGVFSYFLMRGLEGAASGKDGMVTFDDLESYVGDEMKQYAVEKRRVQKPFSLGEHNGDFFIAKPPADLLAKLQPRETEPPPREVIGQGKSKLPLQRLKTIEAGAVHSAAFSPDGRLLATASEQSLRLWNIESGKQVAMLTGSSKPASGLAFSPDSRLLAAGGDKSLWMWEAENGSSHKLDDKGLGTVFSAAFSLDRKFLVSTGADKAVRVWNVETGKAEANLKLSSQGVLAAMSPDGQLVAIVESDSKHSDARLLGWRSGTAALLSAPAGVRSVAFSPDGRRLVGGLQTGTLVSWDISDASHPQREFQFEGHTETAEFVAFSADGRWLASAGADQTFRLWNPKSATKLRSLDAPPGAQRILALSFTTDGRLLAASLRSGEIQILQIPLP